MGINYKVLAQSEITTANSPAFAYTVPSNTETIVSTVAICNRGNSAHTYTMGISVNGAAQSNKQFITYNAPIGAYETVFLTIGVTMGANDTFLVMSDSTDLSFSLFGSEIS